MKAIFQQFSSSPKLGRIFEWSKLISITGSAQVVVQAIGLISGIMVIRLLPTEEYALYTLANTMLGTMTILADGGISAGVMAQGGKVWQDREKLGAVLVTGLNLRKKFSIGSILVSVPILTYLLIDHGASWLMASLLILTLIPAFLAAVSDTLLEIAPKLRQDINALQKNQIEVNIIRLILLGLGSFIFPWAFIAIIAGGLPRIWGNIHLRKITNRFADLSQIPNQKIRKDILISVKRILPGSIYYCFTGQITIWLISIFGSTASLAQIGALGRLAVITLIFTTIINTIVIPRFSRLQNDAKVLLRKFLGIHLAIILLVIIVYSATFLFQNQLLLLIGNKYADLNEELLLIILGNCISLIANSTYSIYLSRGWIINPLIYIPVNILAIVVSIFIFDLSILKGILYLNIFINSVQLIMNITYSFYKINSIGKFR